MIEIKDLLVNIKNILLSEELKKRAIQDAIFEITKIKIDTKNIKIKNGVIYIQTKSIYQNEIFLNKEKVLSFLESTLGKGKFVDIR